MAMKKEATIMNINDTEPVDKHNLAYLIMFYLGLGNLLPWNAFITAAGYFTARFCGTNFVDTFENYFSFSFTIAQTIGLASSIMYQDNMKLSKKIVYPLIFYSIIFGVTTLLVAITMSGDSLFGVTLLSTALCGLCGATLSAGLFGLGALFPAAYTGALMNGQALAGFLISLASLLTTLGGKNMACTDDDGSNDDGSCEEDIDYSALAYFIIATFVLISCIFLFIALQKLEFTKYYISRSEANNERVTKLTSDDLTEALLGINVMEENIVSPLHGGSMDKSNDKSNKKLMDFASIMKVFNVIKIPALSVMFVFVVSIGIFPSLFVLVESTQKCKTSNRFYDDLFIPFMFTLFNLFDFIGRVTAGSTKPLFTRDNIWMASVGRIIFVPLVLLCNISNSQLPTVFTNDAFPIIFMMIFAFTNGYVASNCMMYGATMVAPVDASLAGAIMIFCLTFGLFLGACTSFIVILISQGSM